MSFGLPWISKSMRSICILTFIVIHLCYGQLVVEYALLNVSQTLDNYARVFERNDVITVDSNGWTVNVSDNLGFHWLIQFEHDKWKFKSDRPSTLTMKVYSNSEFGKTDQDMLVSFSQNDTKYITSSIRMNSFERNIFYPYCDRQSTTESFATGDVEQLLDTDNGKDRLYKITDGWNYGYASPENNGSTCCSNQSPMIFKIVNNPVSGYSKYIYTNSINSEWQQQCGFSQVWSSDDYIELFIAGNDLGQTLNIYKFELFMEYDQTLQPTEPPTAPTAEPATAPVAGIRTKTYTETPN